MLSKLFESLYHKIFINIVVGTSTSEVHIEEYAKNKLLNSYTKVFETTNIDTKMYEYIDSHISESPYNYISILDNSVAQGAIHTCDKKEISSFYNLDLYKYIFYKQRWTYFSSKPELNTMQNSYADIGLDFVFSPFLVLANHFKEKINSTLALFILIEQQRVSLAVFDNAHLLYADYLMMDSIGNQEDNLSYDETEDEIDFDLEATIELEEMEGLEAVDDFGDIEDLDSLDEIEEFSVIEDLEDKPEEVEEPSFEDMKGFSEDYSRFTSVQNSINSYYQDDRYESQFLEKIYIADGVGVSRELKRYFEEEMFLNVVVRRIELCVELCELARAEIK